MNAEELDQWISDHRYNIDMSTTDLTVDAAESRFESAIRFDSREGDQVRIYLRDGQVICYWDRENRRGYLPQSTG